MSSARIRFASPFARRDSGRAFSRIRNRAARDAPPSSSIPAHRGAVRGWLTIRRAPERRNRDVHPKYLLYAHPNSYVFSLKQEGEDWEKEFNSVFDAVEFAAALPESKEGTVVVYNSMGSKLVELRVHDQVLSVG